MQIVGYINKNVEFYSKNKFEKLVHLVGFIIRTISKVHTLIRSVHNIPRTTQYLARVGARSTSRTAYFIPYTKSVSTHQHFFLKNFTRESTYIYTA